MLERAKRTPVPYTLSWTFLISGCNLVLSLALNLVVTLVLILTFVVILIVNLIPLMKSFSLCMAGYLITMYLLVLPYIVPYLPWWLQSFLGSGVQVGRCIVSPPIISIFIVTIIVTIIVFNVVIYVSVGSSAYYYALVHLSIFSCLFLLATYSLLAVRYTDPGWVPMDARPLPNEEYIRCDRCQAYKVVFYIHTYMRTMP